jgi:hypothetical protein
MSCRNLLLFCFPYVSLFVVSICLISFLPLLESIIPYRLLRLLYHFCHCFHLVGSNSLLQPGMCDCDLFYLVSHLVVTSLFLLWTLHTFRCFWLTSTLMGKRLCFSLAPSIHLWLSKGVSFRSFCKLLCHCTFFDFFSLFLPLLIRCFA